MDRNTDERWMEINIVCVYTDAVGDLCEVLLTCSVSTAQHM